MRVRDPSGNEEWALMARILIIDDDPDFVESMVVTLENHGYQVDSALSGEEGLNKATRQRPDLIILDVLMETGRKGFEVAQELRKNTQCAGVPILMLTSIKERTGFNFKREAADESWLPVDDYCEKPVKGELLIQKVGKLLKGKT
jgi:CheY-like chemotaxis protein